MAVFISGIQQMGIGVPDVQEIWKWYRKQFGMDIKMFEEAAEAPLMIEYTGHKVQSRTATLAISMQGGGGFEIWQYTSRNTEKAAFDIQLGDLNLCLPHQIKKCRKNISAIQICRSDHFGRPAKNA
jgi:PHP family Zn ribbon phosphoesterase